MLHPYQASGKKGPGALSTMLLFALAGALGGGLVLGIASQWFSLLVVFPIVMGAAVGVPVGMAIKKRNVRAPMLAALIAGVAALMGQMLIHGAEYYRFRSDSIEAIAEEEEGDPSVALDAYLLETTGHSGFIGYLVNQTKEGIELKNSGSRREGSTVTGIGVWGLWLAEALFAVFTAALIARSRAQQPFCERCDVWYGEAKPLGVGDGDKKVVQAVTVALKEGRTAQVAGLLGTPGKKAFSELTEARCPKCQEAEPMIRFSSYTGQPTGKRKNARNLVHGLLTTSEGRQLVAGFNGGMSGPEPTKFGF